jgi:hypothetical protein
MNQNPVIDRGAEREKRRRCNCVHFNGTQNDVCKAGIRYAEVQKANPEGTLRPQGYPVGKSMPCWVDDPIFNAQQLDCPSRVLPTEEQLAEDDRRVLKSIENMAAARKAIMEKVKAEGMMKQNIRGSIPCPNCKTGTLGFTRAGAYNGHVHARCSTEGCTAWME